MALFTFKAFARENASAGVTEPQLRWQFLHSAKNGLGPAFVRFEPKGPGTGRGRLLVDGDAYWQLIRAQQGGRRAA